MANCDLMWFNWLSQKRSCWEAFARSLFLGVGFLEELLPSFFLGKVSGALKAPEVPMLIGCKLVLLITSWSSFRAVSSLFKLLAAATRFEAYFQSSFTSSLQWSSLFAGGAILLINMVVGERRALLPINFCIETYLFSLPVTEAFLVSLMFNEDEEEEVIFFIYISFIFVKYKLILKLLFKFGILL